MLRRLFPLGAAVLVAAVVLPPPSVQGQLRREEGAIYLEDFQRKPVRIAIPNPTRIYFDPRQDRYLGTLRSPQQVELLAFTGVMARVKGIADQGQVAGWVPLETLTGLEPALLEELRKTGERAVMVKELIARKEVAVGMTAEEVALSLGKPERKSSRIDRTVAEEIWEYIRYQSVPQTVTQRDQYGRIYNNTIMVKVPAGQMAIVFKGGVVERIDRSEGVLQPEGATTLAPSMIVP